MYFSGSKPLLTMLSFYSSFPLSAINYHLHYFYLNSIFSLRHALQADIIADCNDTA